MKARGAIRIRYEQGKLYKQQNSPYGMNRLECRVKEFLLRHKDIIKIDKLFTVKRSIYKIKLPTSLTKDVCRFLGILHGDGNMSLGRIHISDKSEIYHKEIIHPLFKKVFGLKLNLFYDKNRNSYYSYIKSSIIRRVLTEIFEVPEGAIRVKLYIPKYLKTTSIYLKAAYLSGIVDAEGHISKRQAEINISTTCEDLFKFIKVFLKEIHVKYSIYIRNRRKNKEYEIYIYGKMNIKNFVKFVKIKHPDKLLRLNKFFLAH